MLTVKLSKEQKEPLVRRVQEYFLDERGEKIGDLAAEFLLDYMTQELGPVIYNQAIQDAVKLVGEKMVSLEDDLHSLEKPIKFGRR
ncbi:DUF2164 domain-containing protein [Paenibacillus sp. N4]|uniref:DUF2164 domain-containing protein n=1 Tax=Paenibacillus vietnamensis TaxID=2590547 RepID=UPI001CD0A3B1|nr:DUF2164 domain-containing protein [Paenibacillus vietnamensis]MCA0757283.1 DUF2164 domain-containing protein [Paenibacillus vietnamensis]